MKLNSKFLNKKINKRTHVARFFRKDIFQTEEQMNCKPDFVSNLKYHSRFEQSMFILKDQCTIFGIKECADLNVIQKETLESFEDSEIKRFEPFFFETHYSNISMIEINEDKEILLAGTEYSELLQFNLKTGQLLFDFGNLSMKAIYSCCFIDEYAVLGGRLGYYSIIDIIKGSVFENRSESAVKDIMSIKSFKVQTNVFSNDLSTIVTFAGKSTQYKKHLTDMFLFNRPFAEPTNNLNSSFIDIKCSLRSSMINTLDEDLKEILKNKSIKDIKNQIISKEKTKFYKLIEDKNKEILKIGNDLKETKKKLEDLENERFENVKIDFLKTLKKEFKNYKIEQQQTNEQSNIDFVSFIKENYDNLLEK